MKVSLLHYFRKNHFFFCFSTLPVWNNSRPRHQPHEISAEASGGGGGSGGGAAPAGGIDVVVADRSGLTLLGSASEAGLQRRLWVKDSDKALSLAKALHALTVFVECAGHSPGTARLAEELLALAWPLRESPFPELRRAVLLAAAGALAHLQVEQFLARGGPSGAAALRAVTAWTTAMGELDADPANRQLARMVVAGQPRELAALGLYSLLASSS